jgi:hypothetical protein
MVDCTRDDIRDLLPDLVHDQLGPAERARVEQHLAECADCAAELKLLRSLRAGAFATPDVNIDRVAAAVRASIAESAAAGAHDGDALSGDLASGGAVPGGMASDDVVSIDEARRRLGNVAATGAVREAPRTRRASGRTKRQPAGIVVPLSWRIAAGIALVAAGAGGYALTRGGAVLRERPVEQATVAASEPAASDAAPATGANRGAAKAAAPTAAAPMMAGDMAGAAGAGSDTRLPAPSAGPLILGDALNELSESDMQALLQSVDDLEAMPDLEPHQLPLLASVVEGAL